MQTANQDKDYLEALAAMHASDVFALACSASGKEPDVLLKELGWDTHFLKRVLSPEDFYPSFVKIPRFCNVTRSTLPLEWLAARMEFAPKEPEGLSITVLLARLNDVLARMGKLAQTTQVAIEDHVLEPVELKRITRDVLQLTREAMLLSGEVRHAEREASKQKRGK